MDRETDSIAAINDRNKTTSQLTVMAPPERLATSIEAMVRGCTVTMEKDDSFLSPQLLRWSRL